MDRALTSRKGRISLVASRWISAGVLFAAALGLLPRSSASARHLTPVEVQQLMNEARQQGLSRMTFSQNKPQSTCRGLGADVTSA